MNEKIILMILLFICCAQALRTGYVIGYNKAIEKVKNNDKQAKKDS